MSVNITLQPLHPSSAPIRGSMRYQKLPSVPSYKTSYKTDFARKEKVKQFLPRPQSPTRKNRPHPINVYYLERLDTKQLVCDVKTDTNPATNIDIIGTTKSRKEPRHLQTCTQESFTKQPLSPELLRTTRYGSNKGKHYPARGIVPIISKGEIKAKADHWLPGTLKLTTTMTMQGPFQYLPRKRKTFIVDNTAAGMLGGVPPEEHRFHNLPKSRGLVPRLTIRSGV